MKFKMLVRMKEGTVPVPHAAPALSDDDVAPVRELSHRRSHSGGGETPSERFSLELISFLQSTFIKKRLKAYKTYVRIVR